MASAKRQRIAKVETLKAQLFEILSKKNVSLKSLQTLVGCSAITNEERKELINSTGQYQFTVLHNLAHRGRTEMIQWLLSPEEGGGRALGFNNVVAKTHIGKTALHLAAQHGYFEACKAIVNGCREENGEREQMLNAVENTGFTALYSVAAFGNEPLIIQWLLSDEEGGGRAMGFNNVLARATNGCTALHYSCENGHLECCQAIVNGCREDNGERHEMLNAVDYDGWTVLHFAAEWGNTAIVSWLMSNEEGGGRAAGLESTTVSAVTNRKALSALHLAAEKNAKCVQALLSQCSNEVRMNLFLGIDGNGSTALHHAIRNFFSSAEVIVDLFKFPECDLIVNIKDNNGMTALHYAVVGGLDTHGRHFHFTADPMTVSAMLQPKTTTAIDPNIGLGL